jgi:hypothetical protein
MKNGFKVMDSDLHTHLEGVSDKSKAKILWDNCARLYNLAGTAADAPSGSSSAHPRRA